ncbi:MAG: hypothetical protein FD138_2459 [Planctomycetota bacterium]|nr:MAG: hypothetical protein FD138_2459 [Planctomycetota bacterium]
MSEPTPPLSDATPSGSHSETSPREFSGKKLIIGLFAIALSMSSGLWIYWYLHTRPFQPLQLTISREFPKSYPYVQGGQRKIHKQTPRILRITLQVPFDPKLSEADQQVDAVVEKLEGLARQQIDLDSYDQLEVHLVQRRPEHDSSTRTVTREVVQTVPSR